MVHRDAEDTYYSEEGWRKGCREYEYPSRQLTEEVANMHTAPLDVAELATIIAALRHWQGHLDTFGIPAAQREIATASGDVVPLVTTEIDSLVEYLNR